MSALGAEGTDRYIVVLHRNQTGEGAALAKEAGTLGAQVEADLGDRVIMTASSAAIDELRKHASVKYVQNVEVGARPDPGRPDEIQTMTVSQLPIESHAGQTWTTGDYAYDGAGNISSIASQTTPGTQGWRTYGYDSVARLSKAQIRGVTPTATYEYSYDAYGNRTGHALNGSWTSISVTSTTNRLGDASYDVRGNQLSRGATVATYDGFDMVTSYRFDAANVDTYVYTAGDERIGVLRGTEWTWSLRDDDGLVLRQYRSSSTSPTAAWLWVEDFVYRDGLLVGSERVAEEGGRRHYHLDHLGSPRLVTASNGSLISEHDFLPFGEERTTIAQHQALGFDREEPLRFTGHERDFDISDPNNSSAYIDYMHARYYATKTGRFLSVDPVLGNLLQPQSWNRYTYVLNNPMTFVDPTGMSLAGSYGITITVEADSPEEEERKRRLEEMQRQLDMMMLHFLIKLSNFSAGFGDAVSLGLTSKVRDLTDANAAVDQCSGWYTFGEVAGVATTTAMGGASAARSALAMGGRSGSLAARFGRGLGRFSSDSRRFSTVSRQYWGARGGANGNHLHHWLIPQRSGGTSAGWNLMVLPGGLNSWMGYSGAGRVVEAGVRAAVAAALAGGAYQGASWGLERASSPCD